MRADVKSVLGHWTPRLHFRTKASSGPPWRIELAALDCVRGFPASWHWTKNIVLSVMDRRDDGRKPSQHPWRVYLLPNCTRPDSWARMQRPYFHESSREPGSVNGVLRLSSFPDVFVLCTSTCGLGTRADLKTQFTIALGLREYICDVRFRYLRPANMLESGLGEESSGQTLPRSICRGRASSRCVLE